MTEHEIYQQLRELEILLHHPTTRSDRNQLDRLLHKSFVEYGRSGSTYTKAEILDYLSAETPDRNIHSQDYALTVLHDDVALLTYRSALIDSSGMLSAFALRSSLWQYTGSSWQMRFHQGTASAAFDKVET